MHNANASNSLTSARRSTRHLTASCALPAAFAEATSAAYARELLRPVAKRTEKNRRDLRRLARQEAAIGEGR